MLLQFGLSRTSPWAHQPDSVLLLIGNQSINNQIQNKVYFVDFELPGLGVACLFRGQTFLSVFFFNLRLFLINTSNGLFAYLPQNDTLYR